LTTFEERIDQRFETAWDRMEASLDRFEADIVNGLDRLHRVYLQVAVVSIVGSSLLAYMLLTLMLP
jgi:hypothetical protein